MSPADAKTSQPGSHTDSTPLPVWSAYGTGADFSRLRCLCCKSTSVSYGILDTIVHSLSEFFGTVTNEKYTWSLCSRTIHFGCLLPALVRPQHAFVEFSFNTIMSSVAQQYVMPHYTDSKHGVIGFFHCILLYNETSCLFLSWDTRLGVVDPSIFASSTDIRTNSRKLLLMQCYRSRLEDLSVHPKMLLVIKVSLGTDPLRHDHPDQYQGSKPVSSGKTCESNSHAPTVPNVGAICPGKSELGMI